MKKILLIVSILLLNFTTKAEEVQYGVVYSQKQKEKFPNYKFPIPEKEWNPETKVWLARSCVGEAGWNVSECIAISWVYATRYRELNGCTSFLTIVKKYSAAIKERSTHKRPWILGLNLKGNKPDKWPKNISWKIHKKLWFSILSDLDLWIKGQKPNPVIGANHFGGSMDRPGDYWMIIKPEGYTFKNIFYKSRF